VISVIDFVPSTSNISASAAPAKFACIFGSILLIKLYIYIALKHQNKNRKKSIGEICVIVL
jgi:hypothetical protein